MTGIMKKTEVQRLRMFIEQRDSQIEALKRALAQSQKELAEAGPFRNCTNADILEVWKVYRVTPMPKDGKFFFDPITDKTPAQLHNERIEQMISEDRE